MSLPILLLTGREGQLGRAFIERWNELGLHDQFELISTSRSELDITDSYKLARYLERLEPSVILNSAAFTDVDRAETDIELAFAVNDYGVSNLVSWCAASACTLVHISTDFVFDGRASKPYKADAAAAPLNVYGASKLEGERHVITNLVQSGYVVRTSWLYSEIGQNFVRTMIQLMMRRRDIRVVNDQIGSPTSVHSLCLYLSKLISTKGKPGIYHYTDGGEISWYEFAVAIMELGIEIGLLSGDSEIIPIPSKCYKASAKRPSYSVLSTETADNYLHEASRGWRTELYYVLSLIKDRHLIDKKRASA